MKSASIAPIRHGRAPRPALYRVTDLVTVRIPRMPVELYSSIDETGGVPTVPDSLLPADARVRAAIAVGSPSLFMGLAGATAASADADELRRKLLRYVIRMSTRATPFGMFAGVGQARWGDVTDVALDPSVRTRTRPDMEWLSVRVAALESQIEVRRHLMLVTNPACFAHAGRFVVSKCDTRDERGDVGVSIRATPIVKKALELARLPTPYSELASALCTAAASATPEKVDALLTQLWISGLLMTDLRPAPTADDPVAHVLRRLEGIPEASRVSEEISALVGAAAAWDALPDHARAEAFFALSNGAPSSRAPEAPTVKSRVQVDMTLGLRGGFADEIGIEAARAAELLLRMTPSPQGLRYLAAYRADFLERYGLGREVPLLELLDSDCGLPYSLRRMDLADEKRDPVVLALATRALFERTAIVSLDEATVKKLATYEIASETAPLSMDVNVVVASRSRDSLDRGDYRLVVGAVMGAQSAGRLLGRFAAVLPEGRAELSAVLRAEQELTPGALWAELVDVPPDARGTNVVIRPAIATHEIRVGASPSVPQKNVIPLRELVVGVRDDRFYLRWPQGDVEVLVRNGHMLNPTTSASVSQFLGDVSRDGRAVFTGFQWGPAKTFPFLPRVEVGRIVLSLAKWRIGMAEARDDLRAHDRARFSDALAEWRRAWSVPRYVYVGDLDHRLLLDLEHALHVEEIRRELVRLPADQTLELQEGLPAIDDAWLEGENGHHVCELCVSLVQDVSKVRQRAVPPARPKHTPSAEAVWRPPGSEWLYLKIYTPKLHEEDVIANQLRPFAESAIARGLADEWFFLRYADPDPHLRLRFRGDAKGLASTLAPAAFAWLGALMKDGACRRFSVDTYDREVERYGGVYGMRVAESIFGVDSAAVAALIARFARSPSLDRTDLSVLTATDLLDALGLDRAARLGWLEGLGLTRSRAECGGEYRRRKERLLALLGDPRERDAFGADVAQALERRKELLRPLGRELARLDAEDLLTQAPDAIFRSLVHMHANRLFGIDAGAERRMYGLLLRVHESLAHAPARPQVVLVSQQERTSL